MDVYLSIPNFYSQMYITKVIFVIKFILILKNSGTIENSAKIDGLYKMKIKGIFILSNFKKI